MSQYVDTDTFESAPSGAERIWAGAVPEPARPATPRAIVSRLFGKGPRGGLNTKAAAEELGVSQRTVQRWIHDRKLPERSEASDRLKGQHEAWRDSPAGRRSALGRKRKNEILNSSTVLIKGIIRISKDCRRREDLPADISQEDLALLVDAMMNGDDRRAFELLEDVYGDAFAGSVGLSIEKLWFE